MVCSSTINAAAGFAALIVLLGGAISCNGGGDGYPRDDDAAGEQGSAGTAGGDGGDGVLTSDFEPQCEPGQTRCAGEKIETCAPTALEWIAEDCGDNSLCMPCGPEDFGCSSDRCVSSCTTASMVPSSAGCEFIANRQLHPKLEFPDAVVIANPDQDNTAQVSLYRIPEGTNEEVLVETVSLVPGADQVWELDTAAIPGKVSRLRSGGMFRIRATYPVIAYQLSPMQNTTSNESSLLLPDSVLGKLYVVPAYYPAGFNTSIGTPTYFEVIALEKNTWVEWTPPVPTFGTGAPIDEVLAGQTGRQEALNRYDTLRITASNEYEEIPREARDLSGTVIASNHPIWVVGASHCSAVPVIEGPGFCDPMQEQLIPVNYWGTTYVAAHPPERDDEGVFWRVYAGADDVSFTTSPNNLSADNCANPAVYDADAETCTLPKLGSWVELRASHEESFVVKGVSTPDDAVMLVGYLQSRSLPSAPAQGNAYAGDAAMYQMVPVQQFLSRYVFRTAIGYTDYVQVIREAGGPSVFVDKVGVQNWKTVEGYEFSNHPVDPGTHSATSSGSFGIVQFGYSSDGPDPANCLGDPNFICGSAYAHPGGIKAEEIFIP